MKKPSNKALVIVESPAKIKTLKKFLPKNFSFASSVGHIRDLPKKEFGIDTEHDFDPTYVNLPDKADVIKKLKKEAKDAEIVYLCPDPDREGEAIAWHISEILPKSTKRKRVSFHSITRNAVEEAFKNPRDINTSLVNAQQARRLLDRIVGYKISPILRRKIKSSSGTSAGRVQSVALKLVVDREKEIDDFNPIEYWTIKATLENEKKKSQSFDAAVFSVDGKKITKEKGSEKNSTLISNEKTAKDLIKKLEKSTYTVDRVEKKEKKRYPVPPFITSTLQQEASRHYGYSTARTMNIAQTLYEGVDMGPEGQEGLITYMRTDSVHVVSEAITSARTLIKKDFGAKFLPSTPVSYKSKKSAQEAHEAIRPTNLYHPPESIKKYLTPDQFKIYTIIWKRFIASQMNPAVYDTVSCDIDTNNKIILRATGSIVKFPGFLAVYQEKYDNEHDEEKEMNLPPLEKDMPLNLLGVNSKQSFTQAPPRFTEASLVKELEKSGIGRPSTYSSIMNKIQSRDYTTKERLTLKPTELGKIIDQMLEDNFKPIMNIGFTSAMEDDLELIAQDKKEWKELIKEFYKAFIPIVEKAEKDAVVPKILTDKDCPLCGKKLQKIWSKNKYFYGCSDYPECKYTAAEEALEFNKDDYDPEFDWEQKCPKCSADMNIRYGRYGAFLGCSSYPKCHGIVNIPKKGEHGIDPKDRPDCPAGGCDGKLIMRRTRFGKVFYSCTNFPDCDVIVNDLADLTKKYDKDYKKTAYKKSTKKGGGKKGSRASFEYTPSKALAVIVGKEKLSRGSITKKLWEYIKEKKLQDPKNKRNIVPDAKLAKIFGSKEPIDMMQLARVISKNIEK
jgi:DNA topoisomerase I